jgi:hypothetical protein
MADCLTNRRKGHFLALARSAGFEDEIWSLGITEPQNEGAIVQPGTRFGWSFPTTRAWGAPGPLPT